MVKRKLSGFSVEFQQQLLKMTQDSPLLLCGTVQARQKLRGRSQRGDWELFKVEVRGSDGRVASAVVNDPGAVPPIGEFIAMPVFVGNNGMLREAKDMNADTF
jgi:hypothetical protein